MQITTHLNNLTFTVDVKNKLICFNEKESNVERNTIKQILNNTLLVKAIREKGPSISG